MSTPNQIQIEQMDQLADQLISQLCAFKATVANLREKMAEVSTTAIPGNGLLDEQQIAALLNKREKTLQKKFR